MSSPVENLREFVRYSNNRLLSFADPFVGLTSLIRRYDCLGLAPRHDEDESTEFDDLRHWCDFGWAPTTLRLYTQLDSKCIHPFLQSSQEDLVLAESLMIVSGQLAFCERLVEHEKAGLIRLQQPKPNHFLFSFTNELNDVESFDRESFDFYRREIVDKVILEKQASHLADENTVLAEFSHLISNPLGRFISYSTTPEIDAYYWRSAYYHSLRIQGYEEFAEDDVFGSLKYSEYLNLVEMVIGIALKHHAACRILHHRNPLVNVHDIITYQCSRSDMIQRFAVYLDVSEHQIDQILDCISLDKNNFESYLKVSAVPPPMFVRVSSNQVIRSATGCLGNPYRILNHELRRRFNGDYAIAVNRREERFRRELYMFFPQEKIIKISKSINITVGNSRTDIDAVLFDAATGTLGLFQLKWQDVFVHSTKERFSRISNLVSKANEWIEKVRSWVSMNSSRTILNSLQIDKHVNGNQEIRNVLIFVLVRNHANFTGIEPDPHVAWGSWYQLIEAFAKYRMDLDDPISEMFIWLQLSRPKEKIRRGERQVFSEVDISFGGIRICGPH